MHNLKYTPSAQTALRRVMRASEELENAQQFERDERERAKNASTASNRPTITAASAADRSANPLRPNTFDQMVGQERLKPMLAELVQQARRSGLPLDHMILIGASGTGKSTIANVMANELRRRVFMLDAPLSIDTMMELRELMHDGDVLFVDEIHRQVQGDRRGVSAAVGPEVYYGLMEDRRLVTATGVLPFPSITVIGATTDAGLLPEPFLGRFPLKPHLERYTIADMAELARRNAHAFHVRIDDEAAATLAAASRSNPRQLNTYVRNAKSLGATTIDVTTATRIVVDLNATALDGLTADMVGMLRFLYTSGRREVGGEVRYQASVNTIATALGKSRDTKAVALYVEPWLIEQGYIQVAHGGRTLTEAGVARALTITQQEVRT